MSLTEYLTQLNTVKSDIKNAIKAKGVDMNQVPFTQYANKIKEISGEGGTSITPVQTNYPGYIVNYGSMTLADVNAAGYIPLTMKLTAHEHVYGGNYNYVGTILINNETTDITIREQTYNLTGSGYGRGIASNFYIDFDTYYNGDLTKCKNISSVTIQKTNTNSNTLDSAEIHDGAVITKWLEPDDRFEDGRIYLFKDGDECTDITGGWTTRDTGARYLINDGTKFVISGSPENGTLRVFLDTANTIVTAGMKLGIECYMTPDCGDMTVYLGGSGAYKIDRTYRYDRVDSGKPHTHIIPITDDMAEDIVEILFSATMINGNYISKIWLEPQNIGTGFLTPETCIPAGIEAIYNTSWENHGSYTSDVFDSGNNNKKGVYLCIRNINKAIVYGSNDQSDWQEIISGTTSGSNDGATGTPKNHTSEEVEYRYFKCTGNAYNNGNKGLIAWGIFEVSGSVEGGNEIIKQPSKKTQTLNATWGGSNESGSKNSTVSLTFNELSKIDGIEKITNSKNGNRGGGVVGMSINGNVLSITGNNNSNGVVSSVTTCSFTAYELIYD